MLERFDIVGIGVSVFDVVVVVDQIPEEEAVVRAGQRAVGLGGAIAVATATAGALGGRVAFADSLGFDPLSESILATLQTASVDVTCVERSAEQSASVATIWVNASSGSRTIVFSPGSEAELGWSERLAQTVASSRILHINGRHLNACLRAVEVAKQNGVLVSLDGGAHRYRSEILPLVRASDVLVVSEHFARSHWLTRNSSSRAITPAELVSFLQSEFDSGLVGVTCGDQGSWLVVKGGKVWHQSAAEIQTVCDTTGCGDTYHGAFLLAMAKGLEPAECAEVAATVAANNAEHLGSFGMDAARLRESLLPKYPKLG